MLFIVPLGVKEMGWLTKQGRESRFAEGRKLSRDVTPDVEL